MRRLLENCFWVYWILKCLRFYFNWKFKNQKCIWKDIIVYLDFILETACIWSLEICFSNDEKNINKFCSYCIFSYSFQRRLQLIKLLFFFDFQENRIVEREVCSNLFKARELKKSFKNAEFKLEMKIKSSLFIDFNWIS